MTNKELISKIKAEIERRKKSLRAGICNEEVFTRKQRKEMLVASEELDRLNRFLSTLESNEPTLTWGDVQLLDTFILQVAREEREGKDWGESEEFYTEVLRRYNDFTKRTIPEIVSKIHEYNELADYARRQVEELLPVIKKYNDYSEEQIEELRTHLMAMFLEGAGWQKEQMLKEAVPFYEILEAVPPGPGRETVRIIIVKE